MNKQEFFQLDTKGKVRYWSIEVKQINENQSDIVIWAGLEDGKKIETITSITDGKNHGKVNATTPYTQAVADAQTEINKKVKNGYVSNKDEIKTKGETITIPKPMKGETYDAKGEKRGGKKGTKNLDDLNMRYEEIIIETKLDGYRCFSKDTIVKVINKTSYKISNVRISDLKNCFQDFKVYSFNEEKSEFEFCEIENYTELEDNSKKWLSITLEDDTEVKCTSDHLWLTNKGWIKAEDLNEEHEIISL